MNAPRTILIASLLAACSSPAVCGGCAGDDGGLPAGELPAAFRVEAEVLSVEPISEVEATGCEPRTTDVSPGPDWVLIFERMHDTEEPTFSSDLDSAARCQHIDPGRDCCRPLAVVDGGWRLECDGGDDFRPHRFVFDFAADGSGVGTTTTYAAGGGSMTCTAVTEWSTLIPL